MDQSVLRGGIMGLLTGLVLSDIVPTPADSIYFKTERRLRNEWKAGTITPEEYWKKTTFAYYFLNPVWWTMVAGVSMVFHKTPGKQLTLLLGLVAAGGVIATVMKNVEKDKEDLEREQQQKQIENWSAAVTGEKRVRIPWQ